MTDNQEWEDTRGIQKRRNPGIKEEEDNKDSIDPIAHFLQTESQNLSYALTPQAVVKKLRDDLQKRFPDKAFMYYVGGEYNAGVLSLEVAVKTPNFLASLKTENGGAEASVAWRTLTQGGWQIELGLSATGSFARPRGSSVVNGGKFSVTMSK